MQERDFFSHTQLRYNRVLPIHQILSRYMYRLLLGSVCLLIFPLVFSLGSYSLANNGLYLYSEIIDEHHLEEAFLQMTNQERTKVGVPSVAQDEQLAIAARNHAQEMASLGYLSHQSPKVENETLAKRIVRAGSAAQAASENIAQVSEHGDIVLQTIEGWLQSPLHRENLLDPQHTHVGFGIATSESGFVYVVQVFAFQPIRLQNASLESKAVESYIANVHVKVDERSDVVVFYGEEQTTPKVYHPGLHVIRVVLKSRNPVQLRLGTRTANSTGGFILQDDGWLRIDEGSWKSGNTGPKTYAHFDSVTASMQRGHSYLINLSFDHSPTNRYGVWVNSNFLPDASFEGRTLKLEVPSSLATPIIELGLAKDDNQYNVVTRLEILQANGQVFLAPAMATR